MNLKELIEKLKEPIKTGDMYQAGFNSAIGTILTIPKFQTTIEKAEKFDKLFEGLRVEKECPNKYTPIPTPICPICKGTGKTSRELTEEEKEEVFNYWRERGYSIRLKLNMVVLNSGEIVEARK